MKKLTNYIVDLGRAVAYYPGLKKLTGSIKSSVLLCQFLYWSDKTKDDGWIYKTADEIEEETGLNYNEQRTARATLVELGILEEEFKRLDHTSRYRVNQEVLNFQWENITGVKSEAVVEKAKKSKEEPKKDSLEQLPLPEFTPLLNTSASPAVTPQRTPVVREKKGDMVDAMLAFSNSPGIKKMHAIELIKEKVETQLNIIADGTRWQHFFEFVYNRQEKNKEPVEKFLLWALQNDFNPVYWTPEKMKSLYPQAFAENPSNKPAENFVEKLPERKEKEYAPMPRDLTRKN